MKKISAICDRCKTEHDDPKKIKTLYVQDGINGEGRATSIDLCIDCYREFVDWLYQNKKGKR